MILSKNSAADKILKEFIMINKKFCDLLGAINKSLMANDVSIALEKIASINSFSSTLASLKKSLPDRIEIEKSKLFEELKNEQHKLADLIEENQQLIKVQLNLNKTVSEYLTKQIEEKIKNESAYSKEGIIDIEGKYVGAFSISNKI